MPISFRMADKYCSLNSFFGRDSYVDDTINYCIIYIHISSKNLVLVNNNNYYCYWPAPDRRILSAFEQHWTIHSLHCQDRRRKHHPFLRCPNYQKRWWFLGNYSLQKSHTHRKFPKLHPRNHIEAVMRALFKRAETHCSNV